MIQLGSLIAELKGCVGALDPAELSGDAAMELVAEFAEVEKLGAAGKLLAGARVAETEVWRRGGARSAPDWMARRSGTDPDRARDALETAGGLAGCPVVAGELRAGRLSEAQAHVIVDAASVRPEVEAQLVELAQSASLRQLREECRRVKSAAASAAAEYAEVQRTRGFRSWIGRDGSVGFSGRLTAHAGAALVTAIEQRKAKHLRAARREGRREPFDAYAADALVELVTEPRGDGACSQPNAMLIVHVDYEAIVRGAVADGEVCEIRGIGPVPLDVARHLSEDAILRILVTKGAQPMAVTPGVRTIPRALRLLLEARDRECVVPGCDVTRGLQVDHRKNFSALGPTDLENCALLCQRHHDMKTYMGYVLGWDEQGERTFNPPDGYLDPEVPDPDVGPTIGCHPWTGRWFGDVAGDPAQRNLVGASTSGTVP